jgi:hypothetical protein
LISLTTQSRAAPAIASKATTFLSSRLFADTSPNPEGVIIDAARKLDKHDARSNQVGIQFIQVGTDPKATEALNNLDNGLAAQGIRNMVDSIIWCQGDELTPMHVLGGVSRRLDREPLCEIS